MTGSHDSVIGLRISDAIDRMIKKIPNRFHTAKENLQLQGIILHIDENTGKSTHIERLAISFEKE